MQRRGQEEPVAHLSAEDESELIEAFDLFDRDGDQSIGAAELQVVMQAIGRQKEVEDIKNEIKDIKRQQLQEDGASDEDIDSEEAELNLKEFIQYISKEMQEREVKEELVEAF